MLSYFRRKYVSSLVFGVLGIVSGAIAQAPDDRLEHVTLQLKRKHQFQFAGYYAAIEQGYYADAGLAVELREAEAGESVIDRVLSGQADFGIATSDLAVRFAKGDPVVALAPILQHSPLVLLVRADSDVSNVHELAGHTIAIEPHAEELIAYLEREGLKRDSYVRTPHAFDAEAFMRGEIVAMSGYSTDEPYLFKERDVGYLMFTPRAGGVDFYGDTLFTSRRVTEEKPALVRRFVEASLKGWDYAFKHKAEMIEVILSKYSTRHSREHLVFEAGALERLVQPDVVEIGYTNPGRWQYIANVYAGLGMMPRDISLEGFLFDLDPERDIRWLVTTLIVSLCITVIIGVTAVRFYRLNTIIHKQKEILQQALDDIRVLRGIIPICSYCKKIQNDEGAWQQMESYIAMHTEADFSHGICGDCFAKLQNKGSGHDFRLD